MNNKIVSETTYPSVYKLIKTDGEINTKCLDLAQIENKIELLIALHYNDISTLSINQMIEMLNALFIKRVNITGGPRYNVFAWITYYCEWKGLNIDTITRKSISEYILHQIAPEYKLDTLSDSVGVPIIEPTKDEKESSAVARLISAAPEMLAALEDILTQIKHPPHRLTKFNPEITLIKEPDTSKILLAISKSKEIINE